MSLPRILAPLVLLAAPAGALQGDSPVAEALALASSRLDAIGAIPDAERTFENTVEAIDDVESWLFLDTRMTSFMSDVSPDADVRAVGEAADRAIGEWYVEFGKREDMYRAVRALDALEPDLDPVQRKLLDRMLRDYRRSGMELPAEQKEELTGIEKEINELQIEYQKNLREDDSTILLTADELRGCPDRVLDSMPRLGDLYQVRMKGAVISPIFQNCEVADTRMKVAFAYNRRGGPRNVQLLEEILQLRQKQATMLGYATFADFQTETRMSGSAARVMAFYEELRPKLRRKAIQDFELYEGAKREHTGDPEAALSSWDRSFYHSYLLRTKYAVDPEKVREYFPMRNVIKGLFDITQALYGVRYEDITERAKREGRPVWHEDVRLFEVWDEASNAMIGEFYIDLHPRDGKYTHAAQFPLMLRKEWRDGSLSTPLVALVCNFTKPTADQPSLLRHSEVETFFHEFGHCLHSIFTTSKYANFSGTQVARDFVEAPSQMFENWVWDAEVLRTFARHYETDEAIPQDLVAGMIAAKNLGSGIAAEGQVFFGFTDMTYHLDEDGVVDTTAVAREVYLDTRLFQPLEGTYFQAAFGHLVGGYAAGYYGYLWSEVFAQDMFQRFEELGMLNPEAGRFYRDKILSKGGTQGELDMLREYLGREPSSDAFLRSLGLSDNP